MSDMEKIDIKEGEKMKNSTFVWLCFLTAFFIIVSYSEIKHINAIRLDLRSIKPVIEQVSILADQNRSLILDLIAADPNNFMDYLEKRTEKLKALASEDNEANMKAHK